MYYSKKREQGYTLITLSIIFMVIGFFILLIMKIGPIYMNHSKILNAFAAMEQTEGIANETTRRVKALLDRRFNLNYVEYIKTRDVKIYNRPNYLKLTVEYEVIEHIVGNLSVYVEFEEVLEIIPGDDN